MTGHFLVVSTLWDNLCDLCHTHTCVCLMRTYLLDIYENINFVVTRCKLWLLKARHFLVVSTLWDNFEIALVTLYPRVNLYVYPRIKLKCIICGSIQYNTRITTVYSATNLKTRKIYVFIIYPTIIVDVCM